MCVYGFAETYKSWLTQEMAFNLVTGEPWIGYTTHKCKVALIQVEQTESNYRNRVEDWVKARHVKPNDVNDKMLFINEIGLRLDTVNGQQFVEHEISQFIPDVMIVDCLYKTANENDQTSLTRYLGFVSHIRQAYGVAVVTVHHPRKESRDRNGAETDMGLNELSGYSALERDLETVLRVYHISKRQDKTLLRLNWQKTRNTKGDIGDVSVKWNPNKLGFDLLN